MSSSLLMPAFITLALVYGIQLVYEGRLFEGILLMVAGIALGFYGEYLLQRFQRQYCDYCDDCRRFHSPRRV